MDFENPSENETIIDWVELPHDEFSGIYGYHAVFKSAKFVNNELVFPILNKGVSKIIHVDVLNKTFKTTQITDFTDVVGIEKENLFIRASKYNSPSALYV